MSLSHWGMFFGVMTFKSYDGGRTGNAVWEPRDPEEMVGYWW